MTTVHPLRRERQLRGWSQERVAQLIETTFVSVSQWERGISSPSPHFREKLCQLFEKNAVELGFVPGTSLISDAEADNDSLTNAPFLTEAVFDPSLTVVNPHQLVGRDTLLSEIVQQLCQSCSGPFFSLWGLPGVGKSALVLALAQHEQIRTHFVDGILWASLGTSPNIQQHLTRWESLLGLPAYDGESTRESLNERSKRLRIAIGQRRFLIILDDVWHAEDALALHVGGQNCLHLVTTRSPLIAHQLSFHEERQIFELAEEDAVALLIQLVPALTQIAQGTAREIVRLIGTLPLALTLVGQYLQLQCYNGNVRRLHAALERLKHAQQRIHLSQQRLFIDTYSTVSLETPLSLYTVITTSDKQLSPQARLALYALSVFPAGPASFSEDAALSVTGQPVEFLDELCDAGLIESIDVNRYIIHKTIIDYARLHLSDKSVYRRFVDYAMTSIHVYANDHEALLREAAIIFAALEMIYQQGEWQSYVQECCHFVDLLMERERDQLSELYLAHVYDIESQLMQEEMQLLFLLHLGTAQMILGKFEQCERYLEESLRLARRYNGKEQIELFLSVFPMESAVSRPLTREGSAAK